MKMKEKKLSVIVPNYNNEKFLDRSVKYLINQAYKNIEIIVVNDGSPGDSDKIMQKYLDQDERVKYVKHEKNQGLFKARLTGADAATGDYIAFLDADDYASIDYYRTLMLNAIENDSDMVFGNTVLEFDDGKRTYFPLCKMTFDCLTGEEVLDNYFKQKGQNYSWHTVWNKIYSKKVWDKARKHYDNVTNRLIMTEDFAFSTVLFYYSNKITRVENDCIYYCQHDSSSTAVTNMKASKEISNLKDMLTSFGFVEDFMKEVGIFEKYGKYFLGWKALYSNQHRIIINKIKKMSSEDKAILDKLINEFSEEYDEDENQNLLYSFSSEIDNRLELLKEKIVSDDIKVVSFDIFDTLVYRPFFYPVDLFKLLDKEFYEYIGQSGIEFSKMRFNAEKEARDLLAKSDSDNEDVTLDEIYKVMSDCYDLDYKKLQKFEKRECELEIQFCERRKTVYDIFTLAKSCGKKVICTSDMYLPHDTIMSILTKNGYEVDKLYLSSDIMKTKWTGTLYEHVIKDLDINPKNILHVGDSFDSDVKNAKKKGINTYHIPKTIDVLNGANNLIKFMKESLPVWRDNKESMQFIGIRTMLAMVANKYFDNPFRTFDCRTDFNCDPYLIGYYALGMYNYSVSKWLLDNTCGVNDTVSFMARDGYLMMKGFDILSKLYKDTPKSKYMYVSRKALIPVMITNHLDFYKMNDIVYYKNSSPKKIIGYLKNVITYDEKKLNKILKDNSFDMDKKFKTSLEFNRFLKLIASNFYDEKKHKEKREKLKKYFDGVLENNPAVFDVGYSGRPEFYISNLCGKKIDTYFLNINKDEALSYSDLGQFKLKTFFAGKPTSTGNAYELLLSKTDPSCIGYNVNNKEVTPEFEEYNEYYMVDHMVNVMQNASIDFINDMYNTFGDYLKVLYYEDYYASLPIMAYINASRYVDKLPLSAVEFEDDIGFGKNRKMIEDMKLELDSKNQLELDKLCSKGVYVSSADSNLNYNFVDLSNKSKFTRLFYYLIFDRKTLKRRIGEITYKFRNHK